jgi:multidrug resistance efflux pump
MHTFDIRKRIALVVFLLLAVTTWYLISRGQAANNANLQVSGTVEAESISMAAELSGRIVELLVDEGQAVKAGDVLFRLDDSLLQSQRARAQAAYDATQANAQVAESGLASAEAAVKTAEAAYQVALATSIAERLPVQQTLDDLTVNAAAARGEAARQVALANRAVRDAVYMLDNYTVSSLQKDLTPAEGIALTKKVLDEAREAFEPYRNLPQSNERREELKEQLDEAQSEYDSAVRRIELSAALEAAQSKLSKAEDELAKLQDGPNPQDVAILEARLAAIDAMPIQAEAGLEAARVGLDTTQARLDAAKSAVAQAQAELNLLDLQIQKLSVVSPVDGVVLTRMASLGEIVQMGAPVLKVGMLAELEITVYLPEFRYGEVNLGQQASVNVDSFPGQQFSATVVAIADQAEFTPRNVQTEEGRRNTVFAIKLSIENPDGRLKPGMPADVDFDR